MQDRLYLNDSRIQDMANAIRQIASQTEPVGRVLDGWLTKDNLNIQKYQFLSVLLQSYMRVVQM